MAVHRLEAELLGRETEFEYSEHWIGYSLLVIRLTMGWILLQSGIQKALNPSWTAAGYLKNGIPAGNPLTEFWTMLAGTPGVDTLVIAGFILTGLGILCGALLRFSVFSASLMMLLFWASALQGGPMQGFPVEHGWFVDSHLVYVALLFGLGAFGAGRIAGVDEFVEKTSVVERYPRLKYLMG